MQTLVYTLLKQYVQRFITIIAVLKENLDLYNDILKHSKDLSIYNYYKSCTEHLGK